MGPRDPVATASLLQDLAIVMGTAAVIAVVFKRFHLPALFGFLVAGFLIGPNSPPFALVHEKETLTALADIGVALLLFGLGLTFNFRHLRRVGGVAFVVMAAEALLMLWLGFEMGRLLGWTLLESVFLGAMLSISSTTITVKVLQDLGRLEAESSRIVFGVLIWEDIVAVATLVILSGYAITGGDLPFNELAKVAGRMSLFLLGTLFLGPLIVPRLVDYVARQRSNELLVLFVLGLGLGFSLLAELAGFHAALGAFLMGAVVAESKQHDHVERLLRPVSDMFGAIFFVTVGTLVDPGAITQYWKPVVLIALLVLIGKTLSGAIPSFLMGYRPTTALAIGTGLAQIGEFSFVIAFLGATTGATGPHVFPIIVAVSALTSLIAPFAMRYSDSMASGLSYFAPKALQTYARVYVTWMTSMRARTGAVQRERVRARRSAALSAILLATALGALLLLSVPGRTLLVDQGLRDPGLTLAYWGVGAALLLPLLFRTFVGVNRWLATWDVPEEGRRPSGVRNLVRLSLYLLGAVLLGLPVLAATAPLIRTPIVALVWVALVTVAAVVLWASINRLHARIEHNVQALLNDERIPVSAPRVVQDLLQADFPWDLSLDAVEVAPHTWAAGKRVGEMDLRGSTGASLILLERGDLREETPHRNTVLLPGDRITLIGTKEQVEAAKLVLRRPIPEGRGRPELRLGRLYVAESSELEGVRLADAGLPERSGLQVVAIVREDTAVANPSPNERFQAGDILIVLGPQEQITAAMDLVRAKAQRAPAGAGDAG